MNRARATLIAALLAATVWIPASARADQPTGPWGTEDANTWCLEHGDYSNPDAPRFPAECSAYWHPVTETHAAQPTTTEVHAPPAPRARTQGSAIAYNRAPLAATASLAELVPLAGFGLLLFGAGLDLHRRASRRRLTLAELLAPYGRAKEAGR